MRGESIAEVGCSLMLAVVTGLYGFGGAGVCGLCLPCNSSELECGNSSALRPGEPAPLRYVEPADSDRDPTAAPRLVPGEAPANSRLLAEVGSAGVVSFAPDDDSSVFLACETREPTGHPGLSLAPAVR